MYHIVCVEMKDGEGKVPEEAPDAFFGEVEFLLALPLDQGVEVALLGAFCDDEQLVVFEEGTVELYYVRVLYLLQNKHFY